MRCAPFLVSLGAALWLLAAPAAQAMGFGRTALATTLGQRLDFSAVVSLDVDETLPRECVAAEVHVGDALLPQAAVRVTLEPQGTGNARRVRVTSATLIDEPVVTIEVSVGCNSRMSRRFVTFIDPPLLNLAEASPPLPQQSARESQVAPILEASRNASRRARAEADAYSAGPAGTVASEPRLRKTARLAPRNERVATAASAATAHADSAPDHARERRGKTRTASHGSARNFAAAPAQGTSRLQLEAPPPAVLAAAAAAASATAASAAVPSPVLSTTVAAVAAATDAAAAAAGPVDATTAAALAHERERIQLLEAGLAQLHAESVSTQKSLALLQVRLREAEEDRFANWLVYSLAGGLLFFAALAALFWALRPRQRRRARWFDAAANQKARAERNPVVDAPLAAATAARDSASLDLQDTPSWGGHPSVLNTQPATIGGLEVTTVLGPEVSRPITTTAAANSAHGAGSNGARRSGSASMEELIDLEQQVEFFVVLGQEEAAIALLEGHLGEEGGSSPLPYLKLLEIHQRRVDRPAYEHVREVFEARFHAQAPDWGADLTFGRAVEDYPQVLARLQSLWGTPLHAMHTLDGLLFGRGENDGAFDFPAYRELLFLYSIARELAGNVETDLGSIDLFLPLDNAAGASLPGGPEDPDDAGESAFAVDLDVSGWAADEPVENLVILRSPGRHGAG